MSERDHRSGGTAPEAIFGQSVPRRRNKAQPAQMSLERDDLPLFSGTPQHVIDQPFRPQENLYQQLTLPGMPDIDWEAVPATDKHFRSQDTSGSIVIAQEGTIWKQTQQSGTELNTTIEERYDESSEEDEALYLRTVLARYNIDVPRLRAYIAEGEDIEELIRSRNMPSEIQHLLLFVALLFRPLSTEQIHSPGEAAALLMAEMAYLDQEQFRVLCLDTKNRLQKMHLVYQGSLNAAMIRIGEVYKEPLRLNGAAIIIAHNHPSGDPTPSPEDIFVTRQIAEAGKLLDVECLDHLIIGQGKWLSMKQKGYGFSIA